MTSDTAVENTGDEHDLGLPPSPIPADRGAIGTEMAIVVAIVVAIALALGLVMRQSANSHQACIPATPGAAVPAGCATSN